MGDQTSPADHSLTELVRSLPFIACALGPDGEVLVSNEAWRAFGEENGSPNPTSEGENYIDVCQRAEEPHASEIQEGLERLLDGEISRFQTTYPHHGPETERWFDLVACRLVMDGEGYVLTLHLDATSKTQAELEMNAEVERLEALARVLSHDLRAPLSVASGYTRLLDEEVDSPHLERVETALERIATIAENAVLIARGTAIERTEDVDLVPFARQIWSGLDTEGASLVIEDDLHVEGDPGLVSELLENLFRNALDHAGPEPTVVVGSLEGGGGFYVADDGPGIPPADRDNVFDIGYTTGTGTGFGLDIVKRIAEAHGWEVRVAESETGGARFELVTGEE